MDVSEGGLCLLSQVWLEPGRIVEILTDVPGAGESRIRARVWHVRRQRLAESNRRVWTIGLMLKAPDEAYGRLLCAAGAAERAEPSAGTASAELDSPLAFTPRGAVGAEAAGIFRIRVKATSGPRTRILTLMASSEEEARTLAAQDLGGRWSVLEVMAS